MSYGISIAWCETLYDWADFLTWRNRQVCYIIQVGSLIIRIKYKYVNRCHNTWIFIIHFDLRTLSKSQISELELTVSLNEAAISRSSLTFVVILPLFRWTVKARDSNARFDHLLNRLIFNRSLKENRVPSPKRTKLTDEVKSKSIVFTWPISLPTGVSSSMYIDAYSSTV